MKHIEELPIERFTELVMNVHCWTPTIKIDGTCAINFGFDELGFFYTAFGRDFKNTPIDQRKYSTGDWLKRNIIMNNPGIFVHAILEKYQYILRPNLKNNEPVIAEILFQSQPNCVRYKLSANQIIILNNPILERLLKTSFGTILIPQLHIENYEIIIKKESLPYQFSGTPYINPYLFNIKEEVENLSKYLSKTVDGFSTKELYLSRITNKNREQVSKIREEVEVLKLKIKDKLISTLNGISSAIEPEIGYIHEGFVIQFKNYLVKVVDKTNFTRYHEINWQPAHDAKRIRVDIGKGEMLKKEGLSRLEKMINNFDTLYPDISKDMIELMKNQIIMAYIDIRGRNK